MWLGIALGGGIGLAYVTASRITHRSTAHYEGKRFVAVFLIGMITRMGIALVLVTLILVLVPVHSLAFVSSFLITFVIGLILEVVGLHRAGSSPPRHPSP